MISSFVQILTIVNLLLYLYLIITFGLRWKISKAHRRFFFLLILSFLWILDVYLEWTMTTLEFYELIVHINYFLAPLVAGMIVSFALHFPRRDLKIKIFEEIIILLPLFVISTLALVTEWFVSVSGIKEVEVMKGGYLIYITILITYFIFIAGIILVRKYRSSIGIPKQQLRFIIFGYSIAMILLLIQSVHTNILGVLPVNIDLLFTNTSILFSAIVAYAMLRYRFMDIRVVIRKGAIYLISFIFALAIYTYLVLILKNTIEQSWDISPGWTTFILVGLVALGVPLLKNLVERSINTLFKGRKSIDLAVNELRKKVAEKTDLEVIVDLISDEIKKFLEVNEVKMFIINHRDKNLVHKEEGIEEKIDFNNDLLKYFDKYSDVLIRDEIPHIIEDRVGEFERDILQKAEKEMKKRKASLAMPLKTEEEVFGFVLLGNRSKGQAYTVQDVKFLERLREQVQFVLANAVLYKEAVERIKLTNASHSEERH